MASNQPPALRIPQPAGLEEAQRLVVGAKVAIYWGGGIDDWFTAVVREVYCISEDDEVVDLTSDDPPAPFQVNVFYPAQKGYDDDAEDKDWHDVFESDGAELLELPPGGLQAFPQFVPPGAAARSRQPRLAATPPAQAAAANPAAQAAAATPAAQAGGRAASGSSSKRGHRPKTASSDDEWQPAKRVRSGGRGGYARQRREEAGGAEGVGEDEDEAGPSRRRPRHAQRAQHASGGGAYLDMEVDDDEEEDEDEWEPLRLLPQDSQQPPPLHPQHPPPQQQQQQEQAGGSGRARGPARGKGSQRPGLLPSHLASPGGGGRAGGGGGGGGGGGAEREPPVATQRTPQRRVRAPRVQADYSGVPDPVGAPRAGIIKRVEVWNFLCHRHLAMDFNPRVNLLSGTNGSGKSAVIVALQCCLGARASDTGRFSSFRNSVKEGESQAMIKVTLWNTGTDACRRAELGPVLTVVRKIFPKGGGTHTVEDHTGCMVLKGTKAVRELVEDLCINCCNPATVLTQEMAKTFASEQSEGDKFEGFMQATQFDKTKAYLLESFSHISQVEGLVAGLAADVDRLAAQQAQQEEKLEQMKEVDTWQRDRTDLSQILVWTPFQSTEKAIAKLRDVLEHELPAELSACQQRVASYAQQRTVLNAQNEEQARVLREIEVAERGIGAERAAVKSAVKEKKREVAQLRQELGERRRELKDAEEEKAELEAATRNVDDEFVRSTQQQADAHRKLVGERRDQCERAGVASTTARQDLTAREIAVERAREEARGASVALRTGQQHVAQLEAALRNLVAAQQAPLEKFGGWPAAELHRAIQEAVAQGRFTAPPIHIGSSVSLADGTWATAVEAAVGRKLNDWIVNNQKDLNVIWTLRERLSQEVKNVSFVVMPYHHPAHHIPEDRQPPEGVLTVLRVLRFAQGPHAHVVQNVLIDHASIERTVLVNTREDAVAMVRDKAFWSRYRLATAYAKDGCRAYARGLSQVSAPPEYLRPKLVQDLSQQVVDCRRDVQEAQVALAQLQEAQRQAHKRALEAGREQEAARKQHRAAVTHKQTLDTQYQEALTHQPPTPEAGGGGSAAARNLARLNRLISEIETQADMSEDLVKAADGDLERLQQRQHAVQAAPAEHVERAAAAAAAIAETAAEMAEVQAAYRGAIAEDTKLQQYMETGRERLQGLEGDLDRLLANAEEVCTREQEAAGRARLVAAWRAEGQSEEGIEARLEQGTLARKLQGLETKIGRRTGDAGIDLRDLELQLAQVRQKRWKLDLRLEQAMEVEAICKEGYTARHDCFKRLRRSVAGNVSILFGSYMSMRGHSGTIKVFFKAGGGRLVMSVGIGGAEMTKDMRALSGGERSLASLAFVLALGHMGAQPPFHALDEFDVFMDSINRRMALAFLLEFAVKHPDRQLILLTPQDTSVLEEARQQVELKLKKPIPEDFISVKRMWPPRD